MRRLCHIVLVAEVLLCAAGGASAASPALSLTPIYQFPAVNDAEAPWCNLVAAGSLLYGTGLLGGAFGRGAVFSVDPATGTEKLVYSFQGGTDVTNPQAGLTLVGNLLYGVANQGGANGYGGVYSINPATGAEKVVFSFTPAMGGGSGSNLVSVGGALYGTTYGGGTGAGYGVVFKVDPKTGAGTTLYAFTGGADGASPQTGISYANGTLYGTTTSGGSGGNGTIFAVNAATGTETTLYSFTGGSDGSQPNGGVIVVGSTLYGTATYGGTIGLGTVFSFPLGGSAVTTLYNFQGGADGASPVGPLLYQKGTLYGTAHNGGVAGNGTVFALNTASGKETTLHGFGGGSDGAYPQVGVILSHDLLYGTTGQIGITGVQDGTVFSVNPKTGAETTLHTFLGNANMFAASPLVAVNGVLYGTANGSGSSLYGSIYKLDPATGMQTTLYTFTGAADGGAPNGGLLAVGNLLYGVAALGGQNGHGGVFSFDPATNTETLAASVPASAVSPRGPLAAIGGTLYGETYSGGQNGTGTLFAFSPQQGTLTTIHDFSFSTDGGYPAGGLRASGGLLLGSAFVGGPAFYGTVYSFNPATAALSVLYGFTGGTDGGYPAGPPVPGTGILYGTTNFGGAASCPLGSIGCGVLYSLNPTSLAFNVLHTFAGTADGYAPVALLLDGSKIYGGTGGGGGAVNAGTLFAFDTQSQTFSTLWTFSGNADGAFPTGLLRQGKKLFGVGGGGGTAGQGVVFRATGF